MDGYTMLIINDLIGNGMIVNRKVVLSNSQCLNDHNQKVVCMNRKSWI